MKLQFINILLLLISISSFGQENHIFQDLNPTIPDYKPELFASGFISTHLNEYNITFAPDGETILFTVANNTAVNRFYTIFITQKIEGKWTEPTIAPFSGMHSDADPYFSPAGESVYFVSTRPVVGDIAKEDFDIWKVSYTKGSFGIVQHLGTSVNSTNDELYPTVSANGNLYFSTENGESGYDIMWSEFKDNKFTEPKSLEGSLNSPNIEFDAFVAPDESYIIFTGMGYKDSRGSGDLYISFNENGRWTAGKNLGDAINSIHMDQCPMVSLDGRYLIFTSFRDSQPYNFKSPVLTEDYLTILNSPLNGLGNIFWVQLDSYLLD
ncbi:TolB family protein [Bizionia paragorgiae]|uniref:TolB family protein n=1 Tax=Bizionia paragorgiae TaxID=283786 RepID=UPI003A911A07